MEREVKRTPKASNESIEDLADIAQLKRALKAYDSSGNKSLDQVMRELGLED